jgi:chromosome segregation ATPase
MTANSFIPTGLREIDQLQDRLSADIRNLGERVASISVHVGRDLTEQQKQIDAQQTHITEIREAVDTALALLSEQIKAALAEALSSDLGNRIARLEQIIEPLRITAEDVANGVELRYRGTDGRWIPLQAADVADFVMAGKKVIKLVPQVVQ